DRLMTLIASYQSGNEIVMIGDLILSSQKQSSDAELPSRFAGGLALENPHICGLTQKITILSDRLVAAWAGSYIVARSILKSLQSESAKLKTGKDILDAIATFELSEAELNSVSFIFYLMNIDGDKCEIQVQDYLTGETAVAPD